MLHLHNDRLDKPAMTGMQGWARRAGAGSGRPDAVSSAVGPCRTMGQRMSRRSTSMSLDAAILDEARQLGINLSQAAESGLVAAIRAELAPWLGDAPEFSEAMTIINTIAPRDAA